MISWIKRIRRQRDCMHHLLATAGTPLGGANGAKSFITGRLIDMGRRKMLTCGRCDQRWFV
jgi:hypothetical protein